jgi:hypothetical protein
MKRIVVASLMVFVGLAVQTGAFAGVKYTEITPRILTPVVVESPASVLGFVDAARFLYVADLGNAGSDRGRGGKLLFLPPGWEGDVPEGYSRPDGRESSIS